jgi:hypothetical protein
MSFGSASPATALVRRYPDLPQIGISGLGLNRVEFSAAVDRLAPTIVRRYCGSISP